MKRNFTTAQPLLGKLMAWTVRFVLVLTAAAVFWYIAGSYRRAGGAAQLQALKLCLVLSLLLGICACYGIILDLYYTIRRKEIARLRGILGYLLVMALGALVFLGSAFIIAAAGGNR